MSYLALSLAAVGVFSVLGGILYGWRKSARLNGELKEKLRHAKQEAHNLRLQIRVLSAPPPSSDEQRRVLELITAGRKRSLSTAVREPSD